MSAATEPTQIERVRALAAELIARDGWSREQLLEHRRRALSDLLRHATTASPYYRETLGPDAAERPLHELPTLTKAVLVEHWGRIAADPRLRLAAVEAHATGPAAAAPFLGRFRVVSTSGASGLRGMFVYDAPDWTTWVAAHLRVFARLRIGPQTRLVAIGAPGPTHLTRQLFSIFQAARGDAPRLSVLTPLADIVQALNAYRPEAAIGYASVWALLADEQLEGRLQIRPRAALFGGEPLTEDIRRRIDAAWGIEPANVYATTEAPIVAVGHRSELEITEDLLVVEVVDADNRPVAPGTPGHKVLLTNLANRAQPLIRYEPSDRVTLAAARRLYTQVATVDGRTADTLHLPSRAGGTVALLPYRLAAPFAELPAVRQYQIVYHPDRLHVRLVLRPSASGPELRARVHAALGAAIAAAGAVAPRIDVECVAELEREPGDAAKLKLIKRA